jgi:uncharacterized protein YjbJ (UPF0337 family)
MQNDSEEDHVDEASAEKESSMSGFSQFVVGELETIGGVLTGDPLTQAEGEFNVEVGTVREDIEDELEESENEKSE